MIHVDGLTFTYPGGPAPVLADNPEFLEALRRPNVSSVHPQEASLEDVFVQVTGRSLQ